MDGHAHQYEVDDTFSASARGAQQEEADETPTTTAQKVTAPAVAAAWAAGSPQAAATRTEARMTSSA